MEMPPPYPRKKSNTGLIIGLIIGGVALCCIGPILLIGGGGLMAWNMAKEPLNCSITMTMLQQAVRDYAKANGGKLPDAAKWEDQIRPHYEKAVQEFKKEGVPFDPAPASGPWGCKTEDNKTTTIVYNSELSTKTLLENDDKVLFYETDKAGATTSGKYDQSAMGTPPKRLKQRMWFRIPVSGEVETVDDKGKVGNDLNVDFKTK